MREAFEILTEAPETIEPAEESLHNPSSRQDQEASLVGIALDDLDLQAVEVARFSDQIAPVGTVGPDRLERGQAIDSFSEQDRCAITVLPARRVDHDLQQHPEGVDHDVPLAAGDLFPPRRTHARRAPPWS